MHGKNTKYKLVDDNLGIGVVLEGFGHFLAILGFHQPVDDQIFECGFAEQSSGQYHQGVEPSTRLVQALCNEVRGESSFEHVLVLEWVVELRIWHGARFEPAIEDFVHAAEHSFSLLGWDLKVVDEVTVDVRDLC